MPLRSLQFLILLCVKLLISLFHAKFAKITAKSAKDVRDFFCGLCVNLNFITGLMMTQKGY